MTTWTGPKSYSAEGSNLSDWNTYLQQNMEALKNPPSDDYSPAVSAGLLASSTSSTWVDVHASLSLSITTTGGDILVVLNAYGATGGAIAFDFTVNGILQGGVDGIISSTDDNPFFRFNRVLTDMAAGTYAIVLQWKRISGASSMDISAEIVPQFWAREFS